MLLVVPLRDGIPELPALVEDAKELGRPNRAEGEGGAALPEVDADPRGVKPERGADANKEGRMGGRKGNAVSGFAVVQYHVSIVDL